PGVEYVDHRRIVGLGRLCGAEAVLDMMRTEAELSADVFFRMNDLLALRSDAILVRLTYLGTDRGGGAHEKPLLSLCTFGGDGLVPHFERFDDDRVDDALARLDELTGKAPATPRVENAATRVVVRFAEAWEARDWERLTATYPPEFHMSDRRKLMHMELDRE